MRDAVSDLRGLRFTGEFQFVVEPDAVSVELSEPDGDGARRFFLVCCGCGLVHAARLRPRHLDVVLATPEQRADVLRAVAAAAPPMEV